jgi:hypothetical protein
MIRAGLVAAALAVSACGGSNSSNAATNFSANLNAASEGGGVTSSGTGSASFTLVGNVGYTNTGAVINYTGSFSGLTAPASMAHIHVGAAGVNGGIAVALSNLTPAISGTFGGSIHAADVQAASGGGVTVAAGSLDDLLAAMRAGNTYTNIHTSTYPDGEIRGQNQPH